MQLNDPIGLEGLTRAFREGERGALGIREFD